MMNYSSTIKVYTRKVKRCHWPLGDAETDRGAASGREGGGGGGGGEGGRESGREGEREGVPLGCGRRTEEAGAETEMNGGESARTGVGIFFCALQSDAGAWTWRPEEGWGGKNKNRYEDRGAGVGALTGCVTSAKARQQARVQTFPSPSIIDAVSAAPSL